MSELRIEVERTGDGCSVWAPDLPGCIATGATEEEARARMAAAIRMHIEGLRKAGLPVPAAAEAETAPGGAAGPGGPGGG